MVRVLVTGASGLVGARVVASLASTGHEVFATYHRHEARVPDPGPGGDRLALDLADDASIEDAVDAADPDAVIHAAAISDLRTCEEDPARAQRCNVAASRQLAWLAAERGARFLFLSTDQVFDGGSGGYVEDDPLAPLHVYGRTKLAAETAVRREHPDATVVRLSLVVGRSPAGDRSASEQVVKELRDGGTPRLFTDEFRTPVHVADVARVLGELLALQDVTVVHVGGPERLSRHELGGRIAAAHGLDADRIEPVRLAEVDLAPPRPPDLSLDCRRLRRLVREPPRVLEGALLTE